LPQKIIDINTKLAEHNIPYAFGGAVALSYHSEPRATSDIDINIFVSPEEHQFDKVIEANNIKRN
jgi:hypothetical protein